MDETVLASEQALEEAVRFNRRIVKKIASFADPWTLGPDENRKRRIEGIGAFPALAYAKRAKTFAIEGPRGKLPLRMFRPTGGDSQAAFLHCHPGGWMYGGADHQDLRLQEIADNVPCTVFSVEYGLAPEFPYPAAPDDCEAAALWLVESGARKFGFDRFGIGGESAGANLAASTLLRLRDRHGLAPFLAAVLVGGCYDLGLTPSARLFGEEKLILTTNDVKRFVQSYLPKKQSRIESDVSPLYADLRDLPSALFIAGTRDALLDDTLFMNARWTARGNHAILKIFEHGCHSFNSFPLQIASQCNKMIDDYLAVMLS